MRDIPQAGTTETLASAKVFFRAHPRIKLPIEHYDFWGHQTSLGSIRSLRIFQAELPSPDDGPDGGMVDSTLVRYRLLNQVLIWQFFLSGKL